MARAGRAVIDRSAPALVAMPGRQAGLFLARYLEQPPRGERRRHPVPPLQHKIRSDEEPDVVRASSAPWIALPKSR